MNELTNLAAPVYIPISTPFVGEAEDLAVLEPLKSGWLTQGPKVKAFEDKFSSIHCAKHSLATTSCTTALHLILSAMGIGPGDEVILPSFTWVATANVVQHLGAVPVLADIDLRTFNLSPKEIQFRITPRTKAIIAVHLFGLCADIKAIQQVAGKIPVIEDAACAVGAKYFGKPAGTLGLAGAFSFHPRKIITTGEGGMVTTDDDRLAEIANSLRNHGASISEEERHLGPAPYRMAEFHHFGFNYRMTDLQAALGVAQLDRLEQLLHERRKWADYYTSKLSDLKWLKCPEVPSGYDHSWQSYVCLVDETKAPLPRNKMMGALQSMGIATRPGTHAIHLLHAYQKAYHLEQAAFPNSNRAAEASLAIPLHNRMVQADFDRVVNALRSF